MNEDSNELKKKASAKTYCAYICRLNGTCKMSNRSTSKSTPKTI